MWDHGASLDLDVGELALAIAAPETRAFKIAEMTLAGAGVAHDAVNLDLKELLNEFRDMSLDTLGSQELNKKLAGGAKLLGKLVGLRLFMRIVIKPLTIIIDA